MEPVTVGALAIEGPVIRRGDGKPPPIQWQWIFAEIKTLVRADRQRCADPGGVTDAVFVAFATGAPPRPSPVDIGV